MQALDMQDFDELYQKFFPAPVLPAITDAATLTAAVPNMPNKTGPSNTEIMIGVACVVIVAYGCYHLFTIRQEIKQKAYRN